MSQIRVGRILYSKGQAIHPTYEGYKPIVVLTKSSAYGSLGPYVLTVLVDGRDVIFENLWQSYKWYPKVPATTCKFSRWDSRIIWKHPAEVHEEDGNPNAAYCAWREKLRDAPDAVRYPVGMNARHTCICAIDDDGSKLTYLEARKQLYLRLYVEAVRKQPQFRTLQEKLRRGERLLIIEVDGPHQEKLSYYQEHYGVATDFISQHSAEATQENLNISRRCVTTPRFLWSWLLPRMGASGLCTARAQQLQDFRLSVLYFLHLVLEIFLILQTLE